MDAIRTKDKLFLAVVVPAALVAAYVFFWRTDTARRVAALRDEDAALVTVEDFSAERQRAQGALATAREELSVEGNRPLPALRVKAQAADGVATRERAVLEVFRHAGLTVARSDGAENADAATREVLARTGARPEPVCRRYAIVGSYPQVCAALRSFAEREMAVLPECVEMSAPRQWTLILWL